MSTFSSLLVPLDGSRMAARSLGCAAWLAARLGARLHILSASSHPLPAHEELMRLRVPESQWPQVTLHHVTRLPEDAILSTAGQYDVQLIVMSAHGKAQEETAATTTARSAIGHVARTVIERRDAPVLLLPDGYRESLPWTRILVPVSGEIEEDSVVLHALALANDLGLPVVIAHVLNGDGRQSGFAAMRYADAAHHEYPEKLAELVRRTIPSATLQECDCIKDVVLLRGEVAAQLLEHMRRVDVSLIVIGWHGTLGMGHADVVRELLAAITCPMLLVKSAPRREFRLKVGSDFAR